MSDQVTFELTEEYSEGFDGGSVALPDGSSFDVKAALDAGGGKITLDPDEDRHEIAALAGYWPLQRVDSTQAQASADALERHGRPELEAIARDAGIADPEDKAAYRTKADLVQAIKVAQEQAGDPDTPAGDAAGQQDNPDQAGDAGQTSSTSGGEI